jgi:small redox-active disulfide protein 2
LHIDVYGAGCSKCDRTADTVREVLRALKVKAELVVVGDMARILEAGVMMTPALFIDGKKKCEGRVPSPSEIKKWVLEAGK